MSIERVFALAEALGEGFIEVQIRTRECGDGAHKWTLNVARPGSPNAPPVCNVSGSTTKDTIAEAVHVLTMRLDRQLSEAEERARLLREALSALP